MIEMPGGARTPESARHPASLSLFAFFLVFTMLLQKIFAYFLFGDNICGLICHCSPFVPTVAVSAVLSFQHFPRTAAGFRTPVNAARFQQVYEASGPRIAPTLAPRRAGELCDSFVADH